MPSGVPKRGDFAADDPQDGPLGCVVGRRFIDTFDDEDDDDDDDDDDDGEVAEETYDIF